MTEKEIDLGIPSDLFDEIMFDLDGVIINPQTTSVPLTKEKELEYEMDYYDYCDRMSENVYDIR